MVGRSRSELPRRSNSKTRLNGYACWCILNIDAVHAAPPMPPLRSILVVTLLAVGGCQPLGRVSCPASAMGPIQPAPLIPHADRKRRKPYLPDVCRIFNASCLAARTKPHRLSSPSINSWACSSSNQSIC
jgi:hypothetical protein